MKKLVLSVLVFSILACNFSVLAEGNNSLDRGEGEETQKSLVQKKGSEFEGIMEMSKSSGSYNFKKILKKALMPFIITTVSLVSAAGLINSKLPAYKIFASGYYGTLFFIIPSIFVHMCINERPGDATVDGVIILIPALSILSVLGLVPTAILRVIENIK